MNLPHVPKVRTRTTMSSNRAILALTGITSVAILHALIADRSGELSTRNMKKRKRMKRMSPPPAPHASTGTCPEPWDPVLPVSTRGLDHPLNYEEATDSEDEGTVGSGDEGTVGSGLKGIVPKYIVDMFTERVKQAALRFVNECNAHPRPCPYCGEIPEVVEETIYPGEEHCYVVCNGAKLLPHSISIHGRTREEAVAHWNSFAIDIISQRK